MDKNDSKNIIFRLEKLLPCYLYMGSSSSMLDNKVSSIKNFLKDKINFDTDFKNFNGFEDIDVEELTGYVDTPSLFSYKKVVVIKHIDSTSVVLQKKIADLVLKSNSKNSNIIFIITSLKQKLSPALLDAANKTGKIIKLKQPSIRVLKKWLAGKSKSDGIKFTGEAEDLIIENVNMDLSLLKKEYIKIYDYISSESEKVINEDIIKNLVNRVYSLKIFDLVDYIGKRDKDNSLKALKSIFEEEHNLIGIVTLLHRMFKCFLYIKSSDSKTSVTDYIENNIKVPSYFVGRMVSKYIKFSDNYTEPEILKIFDMLNEYDISLKTSTSEARNLIKKLITEILNVKV
jgi:DNA polymerase III subunit delta